MEKTRKPRTTGYAEMIMGGIGTDLVTGRNYVEGTFQVRSSGMDRVCSSIPYDGSPSIFDYLRAQGFRSSSWSNDRTQFESKVDGSKLTIEVGPEQWGSIDDTYRAFRIRCQPKSGAVSEPKHVLDLEDVLNFLNTGEISFSRTPLSELKDLTR